METKEDLDESQLHVLDFDKFAEYCDRLRDGLENPFEPPTPITPLPPFEAAKNAKITVTWSDNQTYWKPI